MAKPKGEVKVTETPSNPFPKDDLATFQEWFVPVVRAYAKHHGYGLVVTAGLRRAGVDIPRKVSITVVVEREIPSEVNDIDAFARTVASGLGARFEDFDDFDNND